jgi:hypothetical protein
MIKKTLLLAVIGVALSAGGASAWVWGAKGNDTGGIIPWSPEAEANALGIANEMCRWSTWAPKRARITSIRRVYGDYIVYECVFDAPLNRTRLPPDLYR